MPSRSNYADGAFTLSFPPFAGAVKWLIVINLGIFIAWELLHLLDPSVADAAIALLGLVPFSLVHGWIWQAVTYSFLHGGVWHVFANLLGLWFVGSLVEGMFGLRRFLRYYFICVVGAAIATVALAYSGAAPGAVHYGVIGADGANYGLLLGVGLLMGETEFTMLPFPIQIRAKYLVAMVIIFAVLVSLSGRQSLMYFGQLGGLLAGFIYIKFFHSGKARSSGAWAYPGPGLSDRQFDKQKKPPLFSRWRDSYYRWNRRRAARKFEVYMRKHDRKVFFDEHGNYIDPESAEARKREEQEGKSPWVN